METPLALEQFDLLYENINELCASSERVEVNKVTCETLPSWPKLLDLEKATDEELESFILDWPSQDGVFEKVAEALNELEEEPLDVDYFGINKEI